jgi:hypothetical protein
VVSFISLKWLLSLTEIVRTIFGAILETPYAFRVPQKAFFMSTTFTNP